MFLISSDMESFDELVSLNLSETHVIEHRLGDVDMFLIGKMEEQGEEFKLAHFVEERHNEQTIRKHGLNYADPKFEQLAYWHWHSFTRAEFQETYLTSTLIVLNLGSYFLFTPKTQTT